MPHVISGQLISSVSNDLLSLLNTGSFIKTRIASFAWIKAEEKVPPLSSLFLAVTRAPRRTKKMNVQNYSLFSKASMNSILGSDLKMMHLFMSWYLGHSWSLFYIHIGSFYRFSSCKILLIFFSLFPLLDSLLSPCYLSTCLSVSITLGLSCSPQGLTTSILK